jgi:Tol biopolymer transport system component
MKSKSKHPRLKKVGIVFGIIGIVIVAFLGIRLRHFNNSIKTSTQPSSYNVVSVEILIEGGGRMDWSPDGQYIYYDVIDTNMGKLRNFEIYNIFRFNLNTSTSERLIPQNETKLPGNRGQPAISPNGDWLLFQGEYQNNEIYRYWADPGRGKHNNLWVMNLITGSLYQLTDYGTDEGVLHPHFDASGTKLVYSHLYSGEGITGSWQIKLAEFNITNGVPKLSNITSLKPGAEVGENKIFYETHGFSPDGSKLIFTSDVITGAMAFAEIYTYEISNSSLVQLTQSPEWHDEHAIYNPNGTKISWISNMLCQFRPRRADLFLMDADGTNKVRLVTSPQGIIADNAWSPDGKRLVFVDLLLNTHNIYMVTLKG